MIRRAMNRSLLVSGLAVAALGVAVPVRAAADGVDAPDTLREVRRDEPGGVQAVRWPSPRPVSRHRRSLIPAAGAAGVASTFISVNVPPLGWTPLDLAFTPDGSEVAIVNRDSDNVTFLDVATGTIKKTVAVGQEPVSLAVTPDGRYALTADVLGNTVSAIDLASHTLAAQVHVSGLSPFRIRVTGDSRFAVVGLINDGKASAFSVIDLASLHEASTIATPAQGVIGGIGTPTLGIGVDIFSQFALTPDGNEILLAAWNRSAVIVYERATGKTLATVPVASGPWDLDVSSDGAFAVVGHEGATGRWITRIDLHSFQATAFALPLDPFFQINRITPDRRFAVVSGNDPVARHGAVVFLDLQTGAVTARVPTGIVYDIAFTPDGRYGFMAGSVPGYVLDVAAQKLAFNLPGGSTVFWKAAVSPGAPRVAALDSVVGDSVYLYDFSSPSPSLSAAVLTGEPPEGHAPRSVGMAADGHVAVVGNRVTGNVAVIDPASGVLRGLVTTGRTVMDVALTPDGAWAVAANFRDTTISVIDVAALSAVATFAVAPDPDRILLAPDGRTAYVASSPASPGYISFIALDGPRSHVVSILPTVPRESVEGYAPFDAISGVALSGDGSVLAVCGSESNELQLIDTAARREIARVPVGTFPLRVALSRDGKRAWVADAFSNDVTVVQMAGGVAKVQAVIPVPRPFDLYVDPAGTYVYAVSVALDHPAVYVLDAVHNTVAKVADVPSPQTFGLGASQFVPAASMLYVAGAIGNPLRGALLRITAAGLGTQLADATPLSDYPANLGVSTDGKTVVLSQVARDGVDAVRFAPPEPCSASASRLCLRDNRFAVTADWRTSQGLSGAGQALPLTAETGLFWFFASSNLEMVVKVLDGCAVNGRYWVFAGGLTNVGVTLRVEDTKTGQTRTYTNPLGTPFRPIQDTGAFASCP
jgi:YVTN family beta-propeller protein